MTNRLEQFKTKIDASNIRRKGIIFWTVVVEIFLFLLTYDMYHDGHTTIAIITIISAIALAIVVGYKLAKFSAEVSGYEKIIEQMFEGNKELTATNPLEEENVTVPSILYVSNDKVYEIPRPKIDQWAKANPELRTKLEKIISTNSLRAMTNFQLLPEDRQALGMHILLDIGQQVYENVYPHAINEAIASMGQDAFEKEYCRPDLKRKDLEGNPNMPHIVGD